MNRIDKFFLFFTFIYLSAFSSLLIQSKGLFGDNGILPSRILISQNSHLFIHYIFNDNSLPTENVNSLIILGIIISSLSFIFPKFQTKIVFLLLWIIYFSVYQIGQTFLWFQWDILLLETGVIAIVLARNWLYGWTKDDDEADSSSLGFWLVKWLIFRLMFCSGVVKLLSECPTWWTLTALNWHYESQCIPTFLAWFAHQLPEWFQKFSVANTFVIEIAIPILFFIPIKQLQWFSFGSQVLFQFCIILSGNYNFFNLLTITLCLSLLPRDKSHYKSKNRNFLLRFQEAIGKLISFAVIFYLLYKSCYYFSTRTNLKKKLLEMEINFSKRDFHEFLQKFVPVSIYVGATSMLYEIFRLFSKTLYIKSFLKKLSHLLNVTIISVIVIAIFSISLVPYTQIEPRTQGKLPINIKELYYSVNSYEVVNSYGLFRRMTGVGGRPEIVIEGSDNIYGPWKEYEFLYKPGNISRAPPFIIPHQPRIDWQMWFAALGSYQENPWLLNLLYRLLTNETCVIQLFDRNPFLKAPPRYVRIRQYTYSYTGFGGKFKEHDWWRRLLISEYLPPISLENQGFMNYLRENQILNQPKLVFVPEDDIYTFEIYYTTRQQTNINIVQKMSRVITDNLDPSLGHLFVWIVIGANIITKWALWKMF